MTCIIWIWYISKNRTTQFKLRSYANRLKHSLGGHWQSNWLITQFETPFDHFSVNWQLIQCTAGSFQFMRSVFVLKKNVMHTNTFFFLLNFKSYITFVSLFVNNGLREENKQNTWNKNEIQHNFLSKNKALFRFYSLLPEHRQ